MESGNVSHILVLNNVATHKIKVQILFDPYVGVSPKSQSILISFAFVLWLDLYIKAFLYYVFFSKIIKSLE
jgi:hypothetical protein